MRNGTGLAWGALAVLVFGATAQAAPRATTPATGTGGASMAAPSANPSTAAPVAGAPTSPDPSAPATPTGGAAPDAAPPEGAAPDAAAASEAPPTPAVAEEDPEEERARAERKKRKRKRQRQLDAEEADEEDDEDEGRPARRAPMDFQPPTAPPVVEAPRWNLIDSHFVLSIERATNLLSWSTTEASSVTTTALDGFPVTTTTDVEQSGTDLSFLGSGGVSSNPFGVPRIAFDGMFANGFTLGGSLSYLVTSGKRESKSGGTTLSTEDPTTSLFLLAPRIGVMLPASSMVSVWLRAGITRVSASTELLRFDAQTGETLGGKVTATTTLVDLSLDPQLVICPVPHVGITLGVALDIGVSGDVAMSGSSTTRDVKTSSYGVTGGLAAIF